MATQNQVDFKSTCILYFALLAGQLLIGGILVFMTYSSDSEIPSRPDMLFRIIAISLLLFGNFFSYYFYNKAKRTGSELKDFPAKEAHFRSASIRRWALLEGPNLITLVLFFLTKDILLLLLFAIGIAGFIMTWPSPKRFAYDYNLSGSEENALK